MQKNWKMYKSGLNGDDYVHIKDTNETDRIRIDPPDEKTSYTHMHIYDEEENLLNLNGNIVSEKDPAGHAEYNNKYGSGDSEDSGNSNSSLSVDEACNLYEFRNGQWEATGEKDHNPLYNNFGVIDPSKGSIPDIPTIEMPDLIPIQ